MPTPNPLVKIVFIFLLLFVRWFFICPFKSCLIKTNFLLCSEFSRKSSGSNSGSNGNSSGDHGSCRSGCCSRRGRIKQNIPAEAGVMPCEIPVKRSGEILLLRLPLQECFSKACLLLTQKYGHMLLCRMYCNLLIA